MRKIILLGLMIVAIMAISIWKEKDLVTYTESVLPEHHQHQIAEHQEVGIVPEFVMATFHPVTTDKEAARFYFNQGLTLIYAFNHDAAYRSFQKASEIDPKMAMAYWGMALALGPNINMNITPTNQKKAYDTIQKALSLSENVTENEKDYIKALSLRYSNEQDPDLAKMARQYSDAMRKVSHKYPEDLDAAVLFAESGMDLNPWHQWTNTGEPEEGTLEIVNVLESVLKRDPEHLGANHYYIHAIEASYHPERALMSADRLTKMLPTSGHILHMPSHIYILVGDYHKASQSNEQAVVIDRAYIREHGMGGIYPLHYLSHNLYFLSRSYSMEGRFADAKSISDQLQAFYSPYYKVMPELEYYDMTTLFVLLRFHDWKGVLEIPQPEPERKITNILWHFARAVAYASLGKKEEAREEQAKFLKGKEELPGDAIYGYNKASAIMPIAENMLNSKMAEIEGNREQAIEYLREGVAFQDKLHYNEPPDWFFSIRESLGGALLRSQRYAEAEQVFRDDLEKHPRNGRSLFGLLESLKKQSRQTEAAWVEREFNKAWQYSDTKLEVSDL